MRSLSQKLSILSVILQGLLPRLSVAVLDQPFSDSFSSLQHAACVSLFYRDGRLGCGTEDRSLSVGKLVYYKGNVPDYKKDYVAVVEEYDLTAETINTLSAAKGGLLKGILVLNSTSSDNGGSSSSNKFYSPDSVAPQGYGTPSQNINYGYNAYRWNANGEGLFEYDLHGIAMAYVLDSDVSESIREEAQKYNQESAIVAEFNYYMGPQEMNSIDCLGWKDIANNEWNPKCLPLAGTSVWATAGSPPNPSQHGRRDSSNKRPVIVIAAGMDSTSMFHDVTPGANTAASNILTILMAAKVIGTYVKDQDLDNLPNRIVFALFQGESYGFVGSRSFFRDTAYPGFQCKSSPVKASKHEKAPYGCLNPLRPSLRFADLGQINGMISVDQIGHAVANGILYVHADENNDQYGAYLANLLKYSSTNDVSVASSSAGNNNNDGGFPYPPSPLTSLLQLSGGAVGGAVLTGYDYKYTNKVPYHSHLDSARLYEIELNTIASAATILARTALAAAYDDGTYAGEGDYDTPTAYAKNIIADELSYKDSTLNELANCVFYDGSCDLIKKYSSVEENNERSRSGINAGSGVSLGTPPNYYIGVYNSYYGQPFVQVGNDIYGSYDGADFGNKNSDAISMLPRQLESAIHGLFNDFLGRGSVGESNGDNYAQSCKKEADCGNVEYCKSYGDFATCTGGGKCVCARAHYHVALDEALLPAENKPTGYFVINNNDQGISPIYTEPYWSPNVGVRVYRDAGPLPGLITLAVGLGVGVGSIFGAVVLKVGLKKQKLY